MVKEPFFADMATALIEGVVGFVFVGLFTSTVVVFGAVAFSLWN